MKECLECKKEFNAQRDAAKFCCVNCRVAWNRKHGSKKEVKQLQMQVLYNSMLALNERMIENIERMDLPNINIPLPNSTSFPTGFIAKTQPKRILRSAEQWHELKRSCESAEEWNEVKQQIIDAENLSSKQKQIIINTP